LKGVLLGEIYLGDIFFSGEGYLVTTLYFDFIFSYFDLFLGMCIMLSKERTSYRS